MAVAGARWPTSLLGGEIVVAVVSPGPTNTDMLRVGYETGRTSWNPAEVPYALDSARRILTVAEAATLACRAHSVAVQATPTSVLTVRHPAK